MRETADVPVSWTNLPDHKQLPDKDGSMASNFQEHPQSSLLSSCLWPRLRECYGDQFAVGCDTLIYWRNLDPPLKGAKAPDWVLIPGVPATLEGEIRRSYVMWQERRRPLILIEYVSGDGSEERDATAESGKFWVYEQMISAPYYVIFDRPRGQFEVHHLTDLTYSRLVPNAAARVPIPPLGVEVGLWEGRYQEIEAVWLRVWDAATGQLLPTAEEREVAERQRAEAAEALIDDAKRMRDEETERAETERKRADAAEEAKRKLAAKLRELGIEPEG